MKVSVITPSYNQGPFIQRTIESVLSQKKDHFDMEYVIFDGGSTDETVSILKSYGDRLRWVSQKDKGQTDAVNQGLQATDGEIIAWINSDDIYYPNALDQVVRFFQENPTVNVVYGLGDHIDVHDQPFEAYPNEDWSYSRLLETCFICQPALFFRRRVVEKYGLLDESLHYCMDYEYWLRLGKAGETFVHLKQKLAGSRLYAENKTLGARMKVFHETLGMLQRKYGKVPEVWFSHYAHTRMDVAPPIPFGKSRWFYGAQLVAIYLLSGLYWNRAISKRMIGTVIGWKRRMTSKDEVSKND